MSQEREPIAVIGTGYVGLVTAAGFAELGNEVWCVDIDADKIARLNAGEVPIYEPGLADSIAANRERLHFSTELAPALEHARLLFVAVGTPPTYSGDADLSAVHAVVDAMPPSDRHALVMKSTVPVGTGASIKRAFAQRGKEGFRYVSCPEFLKEGTALADFRNPDRVVVGDDGDWAGDAVVALYAPLGAPLVRTDIASAEMVKLASNAFLATKISFINEIANVCEETGADVLEVARGMGLDQRIGPQFLRPGIGYGGSCLAGEETVLVRRHGRTTLVSFEQLWGRLALDEEGDEGEVIWPEGLEVLSWIPGDDAPRFMPVMAATRRRHTGELLEVRTKMGRRVRCTPDHPWYVGDGECDDVEVKLAEELTTGAWLPLAQGLDDSIDPAPVSLLADPAAEDRRTSSFAASSAVLAPPERSTAAVSDPFQDAHFWRVVGLDLAERNRENDGRGTREPERLPDLVWELSRAQKLALLSGLWEGDGSWSLVNGGPSVILEFGTVSRELADGVLRLLADLGFVASQRIGRVAKSTKDTYWLRIAGAEQIERAIELVPVRDRPGVLASIALQQRRIKPTGYRRFGDGPAWLRVTDVRREPFDGWVYSLEVPGAHTFVTSSHLISHNCFPKDVSALKQLAGNSGYHFQLLTAVIEVNELQKRRVISKLQKHLGSLVGKTVALLGLAFKPDTDDMREASSLVLAARLQADGATVRAYDPVAEQEARRLMPGVDFAEDALDAVQGADAVVLVTEWPEFRDARLGRGGEADARHARRRRAQRARPRPRSRRPASRYEGIGRGG